MRGMVIFFGNRTTDAGDVAETEISVMVFDVSVAVGIRFGFHPEAGSAALDPIERGKHE